MNEWMGLDSGGTEQLWDSKVLVDVLQIFKEHEPFSRGDKQSPIYGDLYYLYPDTTWKNTNLQEFRPIFRKTNPWVKLGLTTPETINAYVTPLGEELLTGEKSVKEIFIEASKNHVESDGTRSFAAMCRAALMLPDEIFSLTDVEFAISRFPDAEKSEIIESLEKSRKNKNKFQYKSRRSRTLSGFMNILCLSQALVAVDAGWQLGDIAAAAEIADAVADKQYSFEISDPLIASDVEKNPKILEKKFKEIQEGKRGLNPFNLSSIKTSDPIKKALLLEKANSAHESLVEMCARIIRDNSFSPLEDANSFDIAVLEKNIMIEVKSINRANAVSQFRKAVAQLPEYVWRHRKFFPKETRKILVIDHDPKIFLETDFLEFIEKDQEIKVFWKIESNFINLEGVSFSKYLENI